VFSFLIVVVFTLSAGSDRRRAGRLRATRGKGHNDATRFFPETPMRPPFLAALVVVAVAMLSLAVADSTAAPPRKKPAPKPSGFVRVTRFPRTVYSYQLVRDGKPYFIQGAGVVADSDLASLKALGANSIRTWGVDQLDAVLPRARALGLTVCAGLWLGHERHGFRYDEPAQVARQREAVLAAVRRYKNDPVVLLWGIGNEMEGDGKNPAVWKAVNDLARAVKREDPTRPAMTVIAEAAPEKIAALNRYCPDIDILGVNAYGGMGSLATRLGEAGWRRPFVVTEFHALGPWEGGFAPWGAPVEWNSTQKAEFAADNYRKTVEARRGDNCLGAYAFVWGTKQERTATWFSLLLPEKAGRVALTDELARAWTGKWPANRAPKIGDIRTPVAMREVAPGARFPVEVDASDPNNDALSVRWEVRAETTDARTGGDAEATPPAFPDAIVRSPDGARVELQTPPREGPYRLFVYVSDGKGAGATANVPFFVKTGAAR
jgi:exo-beta-1,3-glucanase (GH17 family)